jgi:transcription elongation GreA/GreB family factor
MPARGEFLPAPAPLRTVGGMDKHWLVDQLLARLREIAANARQAMAAAVAEAREGATPQEKREDARVSQESSGLARGHHQRLERATAEVAELEKFRPARDPASRVALGTIVEVEDDGEGRTFFLAPVGAGEELTGPGGDGFLSVVTPQSPIGRAVMGRRAGETVEVMVKGQAREWTITCID